MFLTLEGMEGCGKSTQAARLGERLGAGVLVTQEPGGTELGRQIRQVLLDRRHSQMAAATELLLYFADRAQHVQEVILPALAAGRSVISDRYVDTSIAYQGYGRGLSLELLDAVARLATGGLRPDATFFLDVPIEAGLARAGRRGPLDRLEAEALEFHRRVRAGYFEMMAKDPARWVLIDGSGSAEEVGERLLGAALSRGLLGALARGPR